MKKEGRKIRSGGGRNKEKKKRLEKKLEENEKIKERDSTKAREKEKGRKGDLEERLRMIGKNMTTPLL